MFIKNKKGAALMQVLLVTAVLAGMAAMLLRATLGRTMTVFQTRRFVSTQVLVDSCMAEVNSLWAAKSAEAFRSDFQGDAQGAFMYCDTYTEDGNCQGNPHRYYDCSYRIDGTAYTVRAWLYDSKPALSNYPKNELTAKLNDGKLMMVFDVLGSEKSPL